MPTKIYLLAAEAIRLRTPPVPAQLQCWLVRKIPIMQSGEPIAGHPNKVESRFWALRVSLIHLMFGCR